MAASKNQTLFSNSTRFGAPVESCKVVEIGDAFIGKQKPSKVVLEITYDLNRFLDQGIRDEWDGFMAGDLLFLSSITSKPTSTSLPSTAQSDLGLSALRGCKILSFLGDDLLPMTDFTSTLTHSIIQSANRLPPDQLNKYKKEAMLKEITDSGTSMGCYGSKRVLLVGMDVNQYQMDVDAGRGEVYGMYNYVMRGERKGMACKEVVEGLKVMCLKSDGGTEVVPGFLEKLWIGGDAAIDTEDTDMAVDAIVDEESNLTVQQQKAVSAGLGKGLTLITGQKGTGKLETAAHLVTRLLQDPAHRILLISPTQNPLTTLFNRVSALTPVDKRYLLKLGYDGGDAFNPTSAQLDSDKYARLVLFTSARAELLDTVDKISVSMEIQGAHGNSCETAGYFFQAFIKPRWEMYAYRCTNETKTAAAVKQGFPFWSYFNAQSQTRVNQPMFSADASYEESLQTAEACYAYLVETFATIESMRAFEILRTPVDQMNYLVTKESRLVAMTATFAMVKSGMFRRLGFGFDSVVFVGGEGVSEVEALVSVGIQSGDRLKRMVVLGDDSASGKSIFGRFLRAGAESVKLDIPVRPQTQFLARLYNTGESALSHGVNPGFSFDAQFVNVPTFKGMDESSPRKGYFQNLGEAEYVVAAFMFMRLCGYASTRSWLTLRYDASEISILTTEAGQRDLIIDILNNRCGSNPIFGKPAHVSTVSAFAGLENLFILGSLVKTASAVDVGAVERMMKSTRKGFYVFGRVAHHQTVRALDTVMRVFAERPSELCLIMGESVGACVRSGDQNGAEQSGVKIQAGKWVKEGKTGKAVRVVSGVEECGRIVYEMSEAHLQKLRK